MSYTYLQEQGEVVFTPFMGVGSEPYAAVSLGRRAIGVELKESYYRQSAKNLEECEPGIYEKKIFEQQELSL